MYLPDQYKQENQAEILAIVNDNPLATLISVTEGQPFVSHLPLILENNGGQARLVGHLARANPHSRILDSSTVTAIFHGPNAYITPTWYAGNGVPTWDYAVVHVRGTCRLIQDYEGTVECVRRLSDRQEKHLKNPWEFWIPPDLGTPDRLTKAIVGFEIEVEEITPKFKLNQKSSLDDRARVINGLRTERQDEQSHKVAELIERLPKKSN